MNILIKKAQEKKGSKRRSFSKEEIELALAFVKGTLSVTQVSHALGVVNPHSSPIVYQFVAQALRQHYSK
jgi:hypothetical protein